MKHLPGRHDQGAHAPSRSAQVIGGAMGRAQRQAQGLLGRMSRNKRSAITYTREEANRMSRSYREKYGPRSWELTGSGINLSPSSASFGDSPDD